MTTTELTTLFTSIENTPKRLEMQGLLTEFYASATPEESAIVSYLIIGRLVPDFIAVEFQLSDKTLRAVVEDKLSTDIGSELTKHGDIGSVWQANGKTAGELSVPNFYQKLWEIALTTGTGSQKKKQELVSALLDQLTPDAGKYALRIMNGKLRLGASERTILESLGKLSEGDTPKLKELYANTSDIGHTAFLFKKYGAESYEKGTFEPGIPVSAKLVEREDSIESIFKRIPHPLEEPKYDGLRIQIHVFKTALAEEVYAERIWSTNYQLTINNEQLKSEQNSAKVSMFEESVAATEEYSVQLFSRNLENMTNMFPEVVEAARKLPIQYEKKFGTKVDSLILDGEVIGYNDLVQEYLPFQQTMTRKRKHDVGNASDSVPVKVFSFDILLVDGRNLMAEPLRDRKSLLSFLDENTEIQQTIVKTPIHAPQTLEEGEKIFETYIAQGLEGVIFKDDSSIYTPGVRNFDWLKFKRAMRSDLADTVDVVLLGYYRGEGKLAAFGIGALLAGVYDKENDKFLTTTKIGTGITHEQWQSIKVACDAVKTDRHLDNVVVPKSLEPDVWLIPSLVVEVEADEITKSPLHTSGYALRFPRFKKFREKKAEDATTVGELEQLANS